MQASHLGNGSSNTGAISHHFPGGISREPHLKQNSPSASAGAATALGCSLRLCASTAAPAHRLQAPPCRFLHVNPHFPDPGESACSPPTSCRLVGRRPVGASPCPCLPPSLLSGVFGPCRPSPASHPILPRYQHSVVVSPRASACVVGFWGASLVSPGRAGVPPSIPAPLPSVPAPPQGPFRLAQQGAPIPSCVFPP